MLNLLDWSIIACYLLFVVIVGFAYKNTAGKSITNFFLGGRGLPWYLAGISMVATTFAADTPLLVTEIVAKNGISGNWLWWNMLIGGMLTTLFFAKLWRRAGIVTELEFIELRYSGIQAAWLRGFKSVYMGLFLNAVIIGWVNAALATILVVFFDIPESEVIWYIAGAMVLVALYSTLSGLIGVVITDSVQFVIAMVGCVILAVMVLHSEEIGGMTGLLEKLPEWRISFFPEVQQEETISDTAGKFAIGVGTFLAYGMVQWWASWYPGAEPGGGGYISQRMMSAKTEKDAFYATLFFQIAHYCLRPWPWIIVALCSLVLYPELALEDAGKGFVYAMKDYLPHGLKGLLLVAFLAAYMSTISTQLNWGASYLTNDLYKRFIRKEERFSSEEEAQKDYVKKSRLFTILIMLVGLGVTTQITTIEKAAHFMIECGAGLGLVLILRWYWWRINAWTEISATVAPFIGYTLSKFVFELEFPQSFFVTVGFTTVVWIVVTYLTQPTNTSVLQNFYQKVAPSGWWGKYKQENLEKPKKQMLYLTFAWLAGILTTYSILFLMGKAILLQWHEAGIWLLLGIVSSVLLIRCIRLAKF